MPEHRYLTPRQLHRFRDLRLKPETPWAKNAITRLVADVDALRAELAMADKRYNTLYQDYSDCRALLRECFTFADPLWRVTHVAQVRSAIGESK